MSGKSIEEILEKMKLQKQEKENKENEELKRINDLREKSRQEYLRLNKMYENSLYNSNTNSSSSSGKSKYDKKFKSYITNDFTFIYPNSVLDYVLTNYTDFYVEKIGNRIIFNDVIQLYNFYVELLITSSEGEYYLGPETHLKDLESNLIFEIDDKKIVEWELVKQLTSQSELGGTSPDNTIGYVLTYSDWDNNSLIDQVSDRIGINTILGGTNYDTRTIDDGPLIGDI